MSAAAVAATAAPHDKNHPSRPPPLDSNGNEIAAVEAAAAAAAVNAGDADYVPTPSSTHPSHVKLTSNVEAKVTLDSGVERNDNVFLTPSNETKDTVVSVTPGISVGFGRHSITTGDLVAQTAFTHYTEHSAPNDHLAHVVGHLSYAGESSQASAMGS
jgi:hypothetical protein